jgi:hypothetical protein
MFAQLRNILGGKRTTEREMPPINFKNMKCEECYEYYDDKDIKKHQNHDFIECNTCKKKYDASDPKIQEIHLNEKKCEVCKEIYNMKNEKEMSKHQSEGICRICCIIYDRRTDFNHEQDSHPGRHYCQPCKLVTSTEDYKNNHASHDLSNSNYTENIPLSTTQSTQSTTQPTTQPTHLTNRIPPPVPPRNYQNNSQNNRQNNSQNTRVEYKFDGEVDEKSIKEKVDTENIWKRVVGFYKNGMPFCSKYIDVSNVPVLNESSSTSTSSLGQNGPTFSSTNASQSMVRNEILDDFELKIKITFPSNLRSVINDEETRQQLKVNAFTPLEKIYEKIQKKFEIDLDVYTFFAIVAGKVHKNSKMAINKILPNVEALLYVMIQRRIVNDDYDKIPHIPHVPHVPLIEYPPNNKAPIA